MNTIPAEHYEEICLLLRKRLTATRGEQKIIRAKIRKLGFNISDYWTGFTDNDFKKLVNSKKHLNIQTTKTNANSVQNKILQNVENDIAKIKKALPAIVNDKTTVLILGSMPGGKSLSAQMYYQNPRNQFWKIIFGIINSSIIPSEYKDKIEILQKNKIGLWDVLESCTREGSLDSNIKNESVNNFDSFFKKFPNIKTVAFNGQKSYTDFINCVGLKHMKNYVLLPSSSSANTQSFSQKIIEWQKAFLG